MALMQVRSVLDTRLDEELSMCKELREDATGNPAFPSATDAGSPE